MAFATNAFRTSLAEGNFHSPMPSHATPATKKQGHVGKSGTAGHELPPTAGPDAVPQPSSGAGPEPPENGVSGHRRLRRRWVTPLRGRGCPVPAEKSSRHGSHCPVTLSFPFPLHNGALCSAGARKGPAAARGAGGEPRCAPAFRGSPPAMPCRVRHPSPWPPAGPGESRAIK